MSDRRLSSQCAVVQALRGSVTGAIAARDDAAGQVAHDALIRVELRLHRMQGFALCDLSDDGEGGDGRA